MAATSSPEGSSQTWASEQQQQSLAAAAAEQIQSHEAAAAAAVRGSGRAGRCVRGLCGFEQLQLAMVVRVFQCVLDDVMAAVRGAYVGERQVRVMGPALWSWDELRAGLATAVPSPHWHDSLTRLVQC